MRPISTLTLTDPTSLSIKNLLYAKKENFPCGNEAGNPKQARCAHLAHLSSQSEHRIHFIMHTHGFSNIKKEKQNTSINKVTSKSSPFLNVSLKPLSKLQINVLATWLLLIGQN